MKQSLVRTTILFLAPIAAVLGQYVLPQQEWTAIGLFYFALAITAFALTLVYQNPEHRVEAPYEEQIPCVEVSGVQGQRSRIWRLTLAALTIGSAIYAFLHLQNNTFTREGTLAWLAAIIGYLLLFWQGIADWPRRVRDWWRNQSWPLHLTIQRHHLILLAIFLLAAFFRFYRLNSLPGEMGSDQAEKLFDVYDVAVRGLRPIFFPRNTGREAMQFYLTAVILKVTGLPIGFLPLKMGTALVSLLTVPLVYLLAKELYGRSVSLLATTLFAISSWHVAISRIGLRFPFTAAFATPTLYFFIRALKYNRRNDWLAAGLTLGIGLHTYIPMRMVPLLLVLLALLKLLLDAIPVISHQWSVISKRQLTTDHQILNTDHWSLTTDYREATALTPSFWQNAILSGLVSLLIFLPLLRYMTDNPAMFWYRVTTRSLENGNALPGETWRIFWDNVKNALLMFNYRGDAVVSNSIPFTPFLGLISGGLFVLGIVYLLWRLVKFRDRRTLYVLLTLFMLLLPSILSLEFPGENPSRVRTGGAIPWAMLIAALPLWVILQHLRANWARMGKWVAGGVTAVLLLIALRDNYTYYFVNYDTHFHRTLWNTSELGAAARGFANGMGDMEHVYHISFPYWVDTRLIGIYAGAIPWEQSIQDTNQIALLHTQDPAAKLYILHVRDQSSLKLLQDTYPTGWPELRHSARGPDKDFMLFFVPPR
ncbi:MAG: glycosyltransferase family 39 protein [Ardenticatenaceae bacterium]|nr:glycosyltransferase family 39 protein [Anaerolineales bacterium]MCB8921061.1 glycosyltransferase family 39 protein [Ardenticatenaceae bacterium]